MILLKQEQEEGTQLIMGIKLSMPLSSLPLSLSLSALSLPHSLSLSSLSLRSLPLYSPSLYPLSLSLSISSPSFPISSLIVIRCLGDCLSGHTHCYTLEVSFYSYINQHTNAHIPYTEKECILHQ